jgi:mono/diheme cytochrome c family protein
MNDPSKLYRWTVLLASLLTIGYLVAAAVRENYLADWQTIQRNYRPMLEAKATDDRGRELLRNYHVEMKQAVIPALKTVDRCVNCHPGIDDPRMTGVPNPYAVHPGNVLKYHPVDRYGCTVCHQGQGPATNFKDAMAEDAFWEYPLLDRQYVQASCLACHDPSALPAGEGRLLREGMDLYAAKSCGSCHKLDGRGGTLGPALDNVGAKSKQQLPMVNVKLPHTAANWHLAHFRDPGGVVAGSQMKNMNLTPLQNQALTVYMLALRQRDVPESYLAPDKIDAKYRALHRAPMAGEQVYKQYCFACHGNGTYGRWDKTFKRFIPAIRGAGLAAASREYLETNIAKGRPGTVMPAWEHTAGGLQDEEIRGLVEYLTAAHPGAKPPALPPIHPGDSARGATIFLRNCAGCHGPDGRGGIAPELGNPTFQKAANDSFITTTIRNGRPGTAMPSFQRPGAAGLSDEEVGDALALIRTFMPRTFAKGTK